MSKKTFTTSISVPMELKKRMGKVKEDINWSAIACQAFQSKLAEIATQKEKLEMDDVIERLRLSKQQHVSESHREGLAAGEEWARKYAGFTELEALGKMYEERDFETYFEVDDSSADGPAERIADRINPNIEFWDSAVGDNDEARAQIENPDFLRGFCDGARQVWLDVASKL
jgi:hypothetical protein